MAIALAFYLTACGDPEPKTTAPSATTAPKVSEVAPPLSIQKLGRQMEKYEPQLSILSPQSDEVLADNQVSVKFAIQNLPIFKAANLGLGPHIHVALDSQEYQALYDINQPIVFDHLTPGTHTLRAFASRPWHESFKNNGAYAQLTFHVLTKTNENTPDPKLPLLTYSRPVGTYGAEPIMLDFYLHNAPLHLAAQTDSKVGDWQVRATINGQTFTFDQWQPVYLQGFRTGQNWVKLELIDTNGVTIPNAFNSSAHLVNYQPNGKDTLAKLMRDEAITDIEGIVNPDYVPPTPTPSPTPSPIASPAVAPSPVAPSAVNTPEQNAVTSPTSVVAPVASPAPVVVPVVTTKASPITQTKEAPVKQPSPEPTATPRKKVIIYKPSPEAKPTAEVVPVAKPTIKAVEKAPTPIKATSVVTQPEPKEEAEVKPAKQPAINVPSVSPKKVEEAKATPAPVTVKAAPTPEQKPSPEIKAAPVLTTQPKLDLKVEQPTDFAPASKPVPPVVSPAREKAAQPQPVATPPVAKPAPSLEATPIKPAVSNYFWEQLQSRLHSEPVSKVDQAVITEPKALSSEVK
ncbi:MAG: hypothetical protein WCO45_08520 [Pseudanabaena sp. ELA607]